MGTVDGRQVALGNPAMMTMLSVETKTANDKADALRTEGKTAMFVAVDNILVGIVAVADPIKETTADAIRDLHALGLRIIMLRVTINALPRPSRVSSTLMTCAQACSQRTKRHLSRNFVRKGLLSPWPVTA